MLVLSRKTNERIVIAAGTPFETVVAVVEIRGDKVRLGIDAPPGITVNRQEVQNEIDARKQEDGPCES